MVRFTVVVLILLAHHMLDRHLKNSTVTGKFFWKSFFILIPCQNET
uniref:Uncharacterized protein n=1 Tax=Anguilla anguilla TaxID=7936 RepID=A0A0E9RUT8_ANGAN